MKVGLWVLHNEKKKKTVLKRRGREGATHDVLLATIFIVARQYTIKQPPVTCLNPIVMKQRN